MSRLSKTKINVLDEFESRMDSWSFSDFERALEAAMGSQYGNYQTSKMTILNADKDGKWPNTVKRYILSNYKVMGNSPSELVSVCSRIISTMSESDKSEWGLPVEA